MNNFAEHIANRLAQSSNQPAAQGAGMPDSSSGHAGGGSAGAITPERFPQAMQPALKNIRDFQARRRGAPANSAIVSPYQLPHDPDSDTRTALRRRASFLLIRDVLTDLGCAASHYIATRHGEGLTQCERQLLGEQVAAVYAQVETGRLALLEKMQRGEYFVPLVLQPEAFEQFLKINRPLLHNIEAACTYAEPHREQALSRNLTAFAVVYLAATGRLPSGLPHGYGHDFGGYRFERDRVDVRVDSGDSGGVDFCIHTDPSGGPICTHGAIVINARHCTSPFADPSDGAPQWRYYADGFEHCALRQRQAASFMQDMMGDLVELETQMAIVKGQSSTHSGEARAAYLTRAELYYTGSAILGERHNVDDRLNSQRMFALEQTIPLGAYARAYRQVQRSPLLDDPAMCAWLESPRWNIDLETVIEPERRLKYLGNDAFRMHLLRQPEYMPRQM